MSAGLAYSFGFEMAKNAFERSATLSVVDHLAAALRTCRCPRPARSRPSDDLVGDCVAAGECGCDCGAALARLGRE